MIFFAIILDMSLGGTLVAENLNVDYPLPFKFLIKRHARKKEQGRRFRALHDVNFVVEPGERVAIVGMNGAGKTTLFRAIAGILPPASGLLWISGHSANSVERHPVGYMAARPLMYRRITGYENLRFIARLYDIPNFEQRIQEMAEMVELEDVMDSYVEQYSTGMTARLDFARVLLPDPPILLLDEPFGSFDIDFAMKAKNIIKKSKATMLMATHNLSDVEEMTDRLILIDKGKIVNDVKFENLSEVAPVHVGKKDLGIKDFTELLLKKHSKKRKNSIHKKHGLS